MHVAIVSPCSSGPLADLLPESAGLDLGCGVYFMATLVRALIKKGHQVSVITLSPQISAPMTFRGPELRYYVYPERGQRRMRDLFKVERDGLRQGIELANPDVLHGHWTYEFAMACLETHFPSLITAHDNAFQQLRFSKDLYRLGRLYMQLKVIRKARFLTAQSPYLASSLQWIAKTNIEVIPNPVEVPPILTPKDHRCSTGSVKIATILNGWGTRKNPKVAIKAFKLLRHDLPSAEMFMYGQDFEERGVAWKWASSNHLSDNIRFRGFLPPDKLLPELRLMSFLLHPSLEESFGMVLVEAMANGVPVVAGHKSGAVPWILDNGKAGALVDVTNPEKIAETLLTCIRRSEETERKRRYGYQRVIQMFSPEFIANRFEKVYEQALSAY